MLIGSCGFDSKDRVVRSIGFRASCFRFDSKDRVVRFRV